MAEALRRQEEQTYEPMRAWLADPQTRWVDRFTPEQETISHVMVSRPAGIWAYLMGVFVFVIGLLGIGAGVLVPSRPAVIAGGLVSLAASALMVLPTGWASYRRNRIRQGQHVRASVPPARYRKRASWHVLCAATVLIVAGLVGVTWPLWPEVWAPIATVWVSVLGIVAGIGLAFVVGSPAKAHPDQIGREEAPGHVGPPIWSCRITGLVCLGLAWLIFCLWGPWPISLDMDVQLPVHLGGLAAVATGAALALFPRRGRAYPVERVPKMPQPLDGGIAHPGKDGQLSGETATMMAWINRLVLDADQYLQQSEAMDALRTGETVFDFLAADWDNQLAQAFRRALETRSGKSLKTLALQPILWTECVVRELHNPHTMCSDLASLFTLQAVRAWMESLTLPELLTCLNTDLPRFVRLTSRLASPHWPSPRVEPPLNACVIAIGESLWEALSPPAGAEAIGSFIPLDWDSRGDRIVILHIAQGLAHGWRGFPGLPGQPRDPRQISSAESTSARGDIGERDVHAGGR